MKTKRCTRCKQEKDIACFYKYEKRNVYRSNCRECFNAWSREYGKKPEVRDRRNKKKDRWEQKNLNSWVGIIPKETKCEVCGIAIIFDSKSNKTSIHFDHKNDSCHIKLCPSIWLARHRYSEENYEIWKSCDFGMLCGKCNRSIPTKDREIWFEKLKKYINGEK